MKIQETQLTDSAQIYELYKRVASVPGGIARLEKEINQQYIDNFIGKTVANGVGFICSDNNNIIGEIHAYSSELYCFSHILSELTVAVDPKAQGLGVGRQLFEHFISKVVNDSSEILRIELIARESNKKAIHFYESLGFVAEGRFESRIKNIDCTYEADIPMAWVRT